MRNSDSAYTTNNLKFKINNLKFLYSTISAIYPPPPENRSCLIYQAFNITRENKRKQHLIVTQNFSFDKNPIQKYLRKITFCLALLLVLFLTTFTFAETKQLTGSIIGIMPKQVYLQIEDTVKEGAEIKIVRDGNVIAVLKVIKIQGKIILTEIIQQTDKESIKFSDKLIIEVIEETTQEVKSEETPFNTETNNETTNTINIQQENTQKTNTNEQTTTTTPENKVNTQYKNIDNEINVNQQNLSKSKFNVKKIAVGSWHTCAVLPDGTIKCWGENDYGQLGNGSTNNSCIPVYVSGIHNAIGVSVGWANTCALLADGTIKCWGANYDGELGIGVKDGPEVCIQNDGTSDYCSTKPVKVNSINDAVAISNISGHMCAILSDGSVKCWGSNRYGELGIGTDEGPEECSDGFSCSTVPVSVVNVINARSIFVGSGFSCALISDGNIQCWGTNENYQLGNDDVNTYEGSFVPVFVKGVSNAIAIATGKARLSEYFNYALLKDGSIYCWGYSRGEMCREFKDEYYEETTYDEDVPSGLLPTLGKKKYLNAFVTKISEAIDITAGYHNLCVLLYDGSVRCFGENIYGQLGIGTNEELEECDYVDYVVCSGKTIPVVGMSNAIEISSSYEHTCALLKDGNIKCWGSNNEGQLGNGTNGNKPFPVMVQLYAKPKNVACSSAIPADCGGADKQSLIKAVKDLIVFREKGDNLTQQLKTAAANGDQVLYSEIKQEISSLLQSGHIIASSFEIEIQSYQSNCGGYQNLVNVLTSAGLWQKLKAIGLLK